MSVQLNRPASPCSQLLVVTPASPVIYAAEDGGALPFPMTVCATPGAGGTLLVETRVSASGNWTAWPSGAVAVKTTMAMYSAQQGLRFTAAAANGTVELAQ